MQRHFETMRKQVEAWQRSEFADTPHEQKGFSIVRWDYSLLPSFETPNAHDTLYPFEAKVARIVKDATNNVRDALLTEPPQLSRLHATYTTAAR